MQQHQPEGIMWSPSFRRILDDEEKEYDRDRAAALGDSPEEISAIHRPQEQGGAERPVEEVEEEGDDDGYGSDDFEFAFVSSESSEGLEPVTADEIFSDGRIRPVYPLFGRNPVFGVPGDHRDGGEEEAIRLPLRRLLIEEERDPPSTSESDELGAVPSESYCVWAPRSVPPSPDLRKKSHSTGGPSRRWRLRDLVDGRSHSDGKEKFFFLAHPPPPPAAEKKKKGEAAAAAGEKKGKGKGVVRKAASEMDVVTAHRLFYGKGGAAAGDRRRSFLPYRKDLVGFFVV